MSFILDALKKSETDRQQQGSGEFSSVPSSTAAAGTPRWLWIVGILLAINLVVLIGVLLRPDTVLPATAEVQESEPPATSIERESSFAEQVEAARQNAPLQQEQVDEGDVPASVTVTPGLISQHPESIPDKELYPTLLELRASGAANIPDLHLDIHVYNAAPEDRFVFINMSKYREGEQLPEGPVVASIAPDGVVLGHQGQFFLLPRE